MFEVKHIWRESQTELPDQRTSYGENLSTSISPAQFVEFCSISLRLLEVYFYYFARSFTFSIRRQRYYRSRVS
jgi:hypothetical protein